MKTYLLDWGDTLMVDFPGVPGKMCDWDFVQSIDGAQEVLSVLSRSAELYIVTGAKESSEAEIKSALARVDLDRYISGYFCLSNIGISKGEHGFLPMVLDRLETRSNTKPAEVAVVGNSYEADIQPAVDLGLRSYWLSDDKETNIDQSVTRISNLKELIGGFVTSF